MTSSWGRTCPDFVSIRVFSRYPEYDWRANTFLREVALHREGFGMDEALPKITSVRTLKTYYLNEIYSPEQMEGIAKNLVIDPVIEDYRLNGFNDFALESFDFMVEITYLPGVVDNEGRTLLSALRDYLKKDFSPETHTASGIVYLLQFSSPASSESVEKLFTSLCVNPLIERLRVERIDVGRDWKGCRSLFDEFFQEFFPIGNPFSVEVIPLTPIREESRLNEISQKRSLHLSATEMRAVIQYYCEPETREERRNKGFPEEPTDAELEVIAQTWSEHCKHKIFAARIDYHENGEFRESIDSLYATYIKKVTSEIRETNPRLLSVFSDNSGVFRFTEEEAICMKVETHNSPSALDPFGGAITGIVGVNRDILGTGIGARPLFNTDVFCFGPPDYSGPIPPKLFHPRRVMKGVHHGVERGGNESGIPTVNGAMIFDPRFIGKPLVFCGTGGVIPLTLSYRGKQIDTVSKEIHPGDLIAMTGGRIGKDGIHGATFSSVVLDETQPTSVVQIGDPIIQKKMTDFLMVARNRLLYRTLTDNGAGGLSSSVGEMAQLSNGCRLNLEQALLKYPTLKPWEILVSESQERMTLAVPSENREELEALAQEYDVEICFIGEFNDDGFFSAYYEGRPVVHLGIDFLHKGVPQMSLRANWVRPSYQEPPIQSSDDWRREFYEESLTALLSHPDIASKENWVRRYDHEVQGITILKPYDGVERDAPMDAAVIKPLRNSEKGLVVSNGLCPRLSDLDTYAMAAMGVDEAVRNAVAVGGNPDEMYGLDNFCWPDPIPSLDNPDGEYKLAQLVRANQAIYDICRTYHLPLISGKDSMKNDYGQGRNKISVPPTLLITLLSVIPDYRRICSSSFKRAGSPVYLLGNIDGQLGGSLFYTCRGWTGNDTPKIEPEENLQIYRGLYRAIQEGLVSAVHDLSDGGLAVALAESCFGGRGGVEVDLVKLGCLEPWKKLFSEPAGSFVVEVISEREREFLSRIQKYTSRVQEIGKTLAVPRFRVSDSSYTNEILLDRDIVELKKVWQTPFAFD